MRGHPEAGHCAASLPALGRRESLPVGVDTHDAVDRDPGGEDVRDGGHCLVGGVDHGQLGHDEAEGGPGHPGQQQPALLQPDPRQERERHEEVDRDTDGVHRHYQLQSWAIIYNGC